MPTEEWISVLNSSGGSVVVLVGIVIAGYRYLLNHHLPATEKRWSELLTSHSEDRALFREALQSIVSKIDDISTDIIEIKERIK